MAVMSEWSERLMIKGTVTTSRTHKRKMQRGGVCKTPEEKRDYREYSKRVPEENGKETWVLEVTPHKNTRTKTRKEA